MPKFYDENGDGKGVNLPTSVKWNHKDILVEIDTMVNHENFPAAIDFVKNKFLTAPGITNPDGLPGINLVVIFDKTDIPEPTTSSKWYFDLGGLPNSEKRPFWNS